MNVLRRVETKPFRDEVCSMLTNENCGDGVDPEQWLVALPETAKPPVEEIVLPQVHCGSNLRFQ